MKKGLFLSLFTLLLISGISGFFLFPNFRNYFIQNKDNSVSAPKVLSAQDQPKTEVKIQAQEIKTEPIKLLFVGDIMLSRTIGQKIKNGQNPFEKIQPTFNNYDAIIGNLETSVGNSGSPVGGKLYTFQSSPSTISTLTSAGFKAVSLANNHTMDYGANGLTQTFQALNANNLQYFGAGKNADSAFTPLVLKIKEQSIALIGINDIETNFTAVGLNSYGNANFDLAKIQAGVAKIDRSIPLIAMPHWGTEYATVSNSRQKNIATSLFDSGVSLIIGGHPHVVQEKAEIKGKTVYYSMGNFVFDEMDSQPNATKAEMIEVVILDNQIISTKSIPVKLDSQGFPELM